MTSIDELFRKRKLDDPTASFSRSCNKSAKLANGSSPHSNSSKARGVAVKDYAPPPPAPPPPPATTATGEEENEDDLDDVEAGPAPPPADDNNEEEGEEEEGEEDDGEEERGDDEEGRFFECGISAKEKSALNILGAIEAEGEGQGAEEEQINLSWLKKTALSFERKINKNAELRAKFEHEPLKFIGSEADLDSEIRNLSLLADHGELYGDFVRSGCVASLVGLLAHENSDIAVSACQVLAELTDDDNTGVNDSQWKTLAHALIKADIVDLLVSNLGRLDDQEDDDSGRAKDSSRAKDNISSSSSSDRDGAYYVLSTIENLLSEPANHDAVGSHPGLQKWLVNRIKRADSSTAAASVGQNRLYAAEILAILVLNPSSRHSLAKHTDAVDIILQLLAPYRAHEPPDEQSNSEEAEFVQNLFDTLTCLVQDHLGARQFIDNEGIELCLLMLRGHRHQHKKSAKSKKGKNKNSMAFRALQVLDHAMSSSSSSSTSSSTSSSCTSSSSSSSSTSYTTTAATDVSTYFVESAAGLGPLFGLFIKTTATAATTTAATPTIEHLIGILASLLRHTPASSAARIRTLAKFVEDNHAKIHRLLSLRALYEQQINSHDGDDNKNSKNSKNNNNNNDDDDDEAAGRLSSALFILNTLDVVLSWLVAEDDVARLKISGALADKKNTGLVTTAGSTATADGLSVLRKSLQDQLDAIPEQSSDDTGHVLRALLNCLQ